jgi:hypothetical protein
LNIILYPSYFNMATIHISSGEKSYKETFANGAWFFKTKEEANDIFKEYMKLKWKDHYYYNYHKENCPLHCSDQDYHDDDIKFLNEFNIWFENLITECIDDGYFSVGNKGWTRIRITPIDDAPEINYKTEAEKQKIFKTMISISCAWG